MIIAINIGKKAAKPYSPPARVDCIKCETPIEAPANKSPGPKERRN